MYIMKIPFINNEILIDNIIDKIKAILYIRRKNVTPPLRRQLLVPKIDNKRSRKGYKSLQDY